MRLLRILSIVITALIVAGSIFAVYLVLDDLTDRLTAAEVRSGENKANADEANRKTEALATQLKALGETPVVEPNNPTPPQIRYVPVPGKEGKPGRRGLPGLPGGDGASITGPRGESIKGEKGDSPTTDELLTLIRKALAENPPPPGKDGPPGGIGPEGRGIASLSCTGIFAPITFTVTYTDGTSVEFSCGTTPDPEPEESQ